LVRPVIVIGDVEPVAVTNPPVPFRRYLIDVILDIVVVNAMVRNPLPGDTVVMTGAADINGATADEAVEVAEVPWAAFAVWSSTV
jgi:hypothetical protein